jgi:thioester reductase-like protein
MHTTFLTGFPGFLGSELVDRLVKRHAADHRIVCLIQEKFRREAEERAAEIAAAHPGAKVQIALVAGDITLPDLGLGEQYGPLQQETTEIYHLAAVYDLGVKRDLAMRVNLQGTRQILNFARECSRLSRLHYVSTCYVSGHYEGEFAEDDLSVSQSFHNYYEETKYLAEVEVQRERAAGLPVTIYRPSVVIGDSRSGATQKYDGLYYLIRWLLAQPRIAWVPTIGNVDRYTMNNVPSDFVVDALDYLSASEASLGNVYHLSDPAEPTLRHIVNVLAQATDRRVFLVRLPKGITKQALHLPPFLPRQPKLEPEALEYFAHPTRYRCDNTLRDLAGSGIACPPFASYAHNLVNFVRQHPDISPAAMV